MARCKQVVNRFGRPCGAHVTEARHYDTGEVIVLDFMPTSSGEFIITDLGFCGEVTEEEKNAIAQANVLYFTRHNCASGAPDGI